MSGPFTAAVVVLVGLVAAAGQQANDGKLQAQLKKVFPSATTFSTKEGDPPHFSAYQQDAKTGQQALAGFAFWTTELDPLERGYDGPIKMLVGMDTKGILTGILVVDHHEPYGSFSVEPPEFAAQFKGKSIRDPFRVGDDVDAVSRASVTITSATRSIKNSARRVARQLLTPQGSK